MRIALVINATSGSMAKGTTPQTIRDAVKAAGLEAVPETDEDAALPRRIEAAADLSGIDALVVAGGDGSMACAASVMAGRDLPLGLLPLGTMNLLAKDLGLPLDIEGAVTTIAQGVPKAIDVGEVNGHVFLISSQLGIPARMAKFREAQRHGMDARGVMRMASVLMRHLGRYPRLSVTSPNLGNAESFRFHLLAVVNNDFVEKAGRILIRDPVDSGRLTLYVLRRLSPWRILRLGFGLATGEWRRLPGIERFEVTDLEIGSRRRALRVMNDGEVRLIKPPLRYTIRPRSLKVLVPRSDAEQA